MKLTITERAKNDLKNVGTFIARDNPGRARSFVREVREYLQTIVAFPNKGVARDDVRLHLRMVAFGHYLIFYTVALDVVRVERIVHSSRDQSGAFS